MPPIPFHPTHQTPFKSTVSTAQQSRVYHTPFDSASINAPASVQDLIDPSEWAYHAEGGKNILLSFQPAQGSQNGDSPFLTRPYRCALRIPKSLASLSHAGKDQNNDADEAEQFTKDVIVPLLGDDAVLPGMVRIPVITARDRDIIETLSARIEMQRPPARRAHPARIRSESLTCIYMVEDVTAPRLASSYSSAQADPVLCVEIKPKWGFLPRISSLPPSSPNVEIKATYSRYKMHRVAKEAGKQRTKEWFESLYDPLDLYSPDPKRKEKALRALWSDWKESGGKTNNLRLFWNGSVVHPDDQASLTAMAGFLGVKQRQRDEEGLLDALTTHLVAELSKPCLPVHDDAQERVSVLTRLAQLQSALDPLDVEGLAQLWLERTQCHILGSTPASQTESLPAALTSAVPAAQLVQVLRRLLPAVSDCARSAAEIELEDAVQAFLVSATFKDCSLLVRLSRSSDGERVQSETKLVDLDRKPFAKLHSMQQTDSEVCAAFLAWLQTLDSAPAASVAA